MTTLLEGLNEEQRAAVLAPPGPVLVAAVAGAGKTRALTYRVMQQIAAGADPERILALTFSTKAAKEMTMRLIKLGCTHARIGTFHSLALQIARAERPEIGGWRVDDTDRYRLCVKDAVSYRYMNWQAADVTHLLQYIGRCKAAGAFPSDDKALAIAAELYKRRPTAAREPNLCRQAYETAELIRHERRLLTFDDMLLEAWHVCRTDEGARLRWASRYDHVLQDEAQDENLVQHELAAMLAADHRSYTVVGDPAQSIYKFRGADPSGLLRFEHEWGAQVIRMGANYRCATAIVDVANKTLLAMPANTHLGVRMVAMREVEGAVRATQYEDFDAEGEAVTERILESHEDGRAWRDHVVLFRTNAQSRGVEESMLAARIPHQVLGGTSFYERREVKDLLAYLRVAMGVGTYDDVRRSINTPFRFLGKAFIEGLAEELTDDPANVVGDVRQYVIGPARLQQRQKTSALTWCQLIGEMSALIKAGTAAASSTRDTAAEIAARPSTILEHLVRDLRYNEWLTRDEGAESPENNRVSNVRELVRAAARFPTVAELLQYVDDMLARAQRAKREAANSDVVTLCSIHRSKGLEWPVVYVLGVNDKILPHAYAEDIEEERRLFYVACTRAADVLELSYVARAAVSNRVLELQPSPFLVEAGLSINQQVPEAQADAHT